MRQSNYCACPRAVIAIAVFVACTAVGPCARAAFIETIAPDGNGNVSVSGSGSINLSGLTPLGGVFVSQEMNPHLNLLSTGFNGSTLANSYTVAATGPTNFGGGGLVFPNSGGGAAVLFQYSGSFLSLDVDAGYTSQELLGSSSLYNTATLATLGVAPGSYQWSWGSGPTADTITIDATNTPIPEPATALLIALPATLGFMTRRRRRLA